MKTYGEKTMNRQKIGKNMFWIGVLSIVVWQGLTWAHAPVLRENTAEELRGTIYAVDGFMGFIRFQLAGTLGMSLPLIGVLLYSTKKGSYYWLLGFLGPSMSGIGMVWNPSEHMPVLFGVGGTVILLSYLGLLWVWSRAYTVYDSTVRAGKMIQILGYSFLFTTSLLLCSYVGDSRLLALTSSDLPSVSGAESINISLAIGMLLLFAGQFVASRGSVPDTPGVSV
jgi:hypothetical protein